MYECVFPDFPEYAVDYLPVLGGAFHALVFFLNGRKAHHDDGDDAAGGDATLLAGKNDTPVGKKSKSR